MIDRVAKIMARSIGDEGDQISIGRVGWFQPVHDRTDRVHEVEIAPLVVPANQIGLTEPSAIEHKTQRCDVIIYVQPQGNRVNVIFW